MGNTEGDKAKEKAAKEEELKKAKGKALKEAMKILGEYTGVTADNFSTEMPKKLTIDTEFKACNEAELKTIITSGGTEGLKAALAELKIEDGSGTLKENNCQAVWFLGQGLELIKKIEASFKKDDYKPEDVTKTTEDFKKETRKDKKHNMPNGVN